MVNLLPVTGSRWMDDCGDTDGDGISDDEDASLLYGHHNLEGQSK